MRKFLAVFALLVGATIILYPFVSKKITEDNQEKLINDVKQKILENAKNKDNKAYDDDDKEEKEDVGNLELESNDESSIKDSLKTDFSNQKVYGIIEIEKIGITFAIVKGTKKNNIRVAIGHMNGTAKIGAKGNCVLAGHRGGIYGQFFKNLHKLSKGDEIKLTDLTGKEYIYNVYDSFVVKPSDYSVTEQNKKQSIVTLITCEDNGKTRLIVRGKLKE